jgi:GTP-binding protein
MRLAATFLLSALKADQFPTVAKTHGVPEIAFLGRSNVGKSSLINSLLGDTQARVSSTPGRTRAINFFALHEVDKGHRKDRPTLVFADLPGYGYAKISKSISAEWGSFIDPYLGERETLALCIVLVDTNIPPRPNDTQMIDYLREIGRPFLVVGTKSDRISNNTLSKSIAALKRDHQVDEVLPISVKDQRGIKQLWSSILATTEAKDL